MLQNAYSVAKVGADTAENEQHFAEILGLGGVRAARESRRAAAERKFGRDHTRRGASPCFPRSILAFFRFLTRSSPKLADYR